MKKRMAGFSIALLALAILGFAAPASAQTDNNQPGVARVSLIHGDVSMQRGDSGDTSAVDLNTPLVAGDKVFTGAGGRAEVQLDWANLLRMDQNAQADIGTLDRTRIQVQLAQGLAFYSVLKGSESDVEIDTPNVAVTPHGQGRYRIEVTPSGDTLVTVRDGQADVSTPAGSTLVKEGQTITVRGTGNDEQFQVAKAPSNDDFDKWNSDRDRIITNAESSRRTNPYYTGASDMDAYGRWTEVPDYGWVWSPRVAVGWAPYRQGRWVWESYWGWTWVSDEPWGWAPYHYGRWFVHGNSWVWWPGPVTRVYRPVYAPAYVSFFGFGAHSGVSVGVSFGGGFGSIGWLPAGPCDYVNPWWGSHRNNFNVVNVTNITNVYNVRNVNVISPLRGGNRDSNVHNMLVNNQVRYGLSTVSSDRFGHGRDNVRTVSTTELREGQLMTGNVPVVPSRESLRTSDRPAGNFATSHAQTQDHFFSRRVPSTQHESFNDESSRVQQSLGQSANEGPGRNADNRPADNRGGPENRGQDNRPAANAGAVGNRNGNNNAATVNSQRQAPQGAQTQTPAVDSGAGRGPGNNRGTDNNNANNNGWRRFGGGQTGSDNSQGGQATPQLRAPRQNGAGVESTQNRATTAQNQTQTPANNGQPQQTLPRVNSQRVTPSTNPERPAQSDATNQRQTQGPANQGAPNQGNGQANGNQGNGNRGNRDNNANRDNSGPSSAGPSSTGGQGGWQRFSDAPRGADAAAPKGQGGGNSNQGNLQSSPRSDNRTPIEMNRPIIQQRNNPSGVERNASRPDPSPNTNQRVAPAPRPAPQASAPSSAPQSYSRPETPSRSGDNGGGNGNRSSGGGGGGGNGGGARSSASSNSGGHGNERNR